MTAKINYLNNRDILTEIHRSKSTYCSFTQPEYHQYDVIIQDVDDINEEIIDIAITSRAKRLTLQEYERRKPNNNDKVKLSDCEYDRSLIKLTDLIFRVMTYDHIPFNASRKKNPKTAADHREKVNFPPFQHWKYDENNQLICVGKSHWVGDIENGEFSKTHGSITDKLARMFMKLCERYSTRGNVHGYCVDTETEALTKRGWLDIDQINESDEILSYSDGDLKWSSIKSIYRGDYNGLLHKLTYGEMDAIITPRHKMVTERGLIKVEELQSDDILILMGTPTHDQLAYEGIRIPTDHDRVRVSEINFNGGLVDGVIIPTTPYNGRVWCPETEYGCFVARRSGKVYLTGNTYVDEMRGQSLIQLIQIGLQFDESKSDNPFSYFSTVIKNGFCRVINVEKRNQVIRDELLEIAGYNPSFTRMADYEHDHHMRREASNNHNDE